MEKPLINLETLEINDYLLIENDDDALYCAKSKHDVYEYTVAKFGEMDQPKEEFLNQLVILDLSSVYVQAVQNFECVNSEEEYLSNYYEHYKEAAIEDKGCKPVILFNW